MMAPPILNAIQQARCLWRGDVSSPDLDPLGSRYRLLPIADVFPTFPGGDANIATTRLYIRA